MNPSDPTQPAQSTVNNPLNVMSPGEKVICEIKRHPFGILGIYIVAGFILLAAFVVAILAPHFITDMSSQAKTGIFAAVLIVTVIVLLYVYVANVIYRGNAWVVTSDSITQISQVGLFRKQTSQLSLANLEDVTFSQDGFIQSMFGFGVLRVETAGERSKFVFPFCPKPNECARQIIQAHDDYLARNPEGGRPGNSGLVNGQETSPIQQQYAQPAAPAQPVYTPPQQQNPYPSQQDDQQPPAGSSNYPQNQ